MVYAILLTALFTSPAFLDAHAGNGSTAGAFSVVRYFSLFVRPGAKNPHFEVSVSDSSFPSLPAKKVSLPIDANAPILFARLTRQPGYPPTYELATEPLSKTGSLYREMQSHIAFTFKTYEMRGTAPASDIEKMIQKESSLDPLRTSVTVFADDAGQAQFLIRAYDGAPAAAPVFLGPERVSRMLSDGRAEMLYGNAYYSPETSPPTRLPFQESHPYYQFSSIHEPRIELGRAARDRRVRDHLPSLLSQVREFLGSTQARYDRFGNFGIPVQGAVYAEATGVAVTTYLSELGSDGLRLILKKEPPTETELKMIRQDLENRQGLLVTAGNLSRAEVAAYRPDLLAVLAENYQSPPELSRALRPEMAQKMEQRFVIRQPMTEFFKVDHFKFEGAYPLGCKEVIRAPQWSELLTVVTD